MKVNKALKRLAKIEAVMSNVAARYSPSAPQTREALQDAKAAVVRAKEAVEAFFRTAKNAAKPKRKRSAAPRRRRVQKRAAVAQAGGAAKKAAPVRKKAAVKKTAVKAPAARTTKKRAPIKKAVKKTTAKPMAPAQYPTPPGM
jgi:1,4-alpha-glucan branching enzyme